MRFDISQMGSKRNRKRIVMIKDFKQWILYAAPYGDLYNGATVLADRLIRSDKPVNLSDWDVPQTVRDLHDEYNLPLYAGIDAGIVSIDKITGVSLEFTFGRPLHTNVRIVEKAAEKTAEALTKDSGFDVYDMGSFYFDFCLFVPAERTFEFIKKYGRFDDEKAMSDLTKKYYDMFGTYLKKEKQCELK